MSLVTTQTVSLDGRYCTICFRLGSWDTWILDQCPVIIWFSLAIFKEGARNGFVTLKLKTLHPEYFQIVFSVRIITVATVYLYRVYIKSFSDYRHLLQENYVDYKHIFFFQNVTQLKKFFYHRLVHFNMCSFCCTENV
jgi:hypothetical protein